MTVSYGDVVGHKREMVLKARVARRGDVMPSLSHCKW